MRRSFVLMLLFALCSNVMSQFLPVFEEGKCWVVDITKWGEEVLFTYTYIVRGDSIVDGISYKKVYITSKDNLEDLALYYLAREENGVVYFRENDKEHVLFDFNRKVDDEFIFETELNSPDFDYRGVVRDISTLEGGDGITRRCFLFDVLYRYNKNEEEFYPAPYPYTFIEGIGEAEHGIMLDYCIGCTGGGVAKLRCVHNSKNEHLFGRESDCISVGIDGVLETTDEARSIYDIEGRKLNVEPHREIYIKNGKKYINN